MTAKPEDTMAHLDRMAARLGIRIADRSLTLSPDEKTWTAVVDTFEYRTGKRIPGGQYKAAAPTGREAIIKAHLAVIHKPTYPPEEEEE